MLLGLVHNGKVTFATEYGNSCFSVESGKCVCAECYYYGATNVNCTDTQYSTRNGLVPIKWDDKQKKFIVA